MNKKIQITIECETNGISPDDAVRYAIKQLDSWDNQELSSGSLSENFPGLGIRVSLKRDFWDTNGTWIK